MSLKLLQKKIKYKINIFYPEYPFYISKKIAYSHFREQLINQGNTEDFYEHLDKICKINYLNNKSFNAGYIYNNIARLQEMLNEGIVSISNIYIDMKKKMIKHMILKFFMMKIFYLNMKGLIYLIMMIQLVSLMKLIFHQQQLKHFI